MAAVVRFFYRTLLLDWRRTLLGVLAVGAAIVLVVVMEGFRAGLYRQVGAYAEHVSAQLVVVREGVESMTSVRPSLPPEALGQLKAVPGVRETYPMVGGPSIFSLGDRKTPIYIVGYEVVGGPWSLKAGRNVQSTGEVVVDYALARKYGLAVGEEMELLGRPFRVVGLSSGASAIFFSYAAQSSSWRTWTGLTPTYG